MDQQSSGGSQRRTVNEYRLSEDNELRLEVGSDEVILELLEGIAEIFGTQLSIHKRYTLPAGFFFDFMMNFITTKYLWGGVKRLIYKGSLLVFYPSEIYGDLEIPPPLCTCSGGWLHRVTY